MRAPRRTRRVSAALLLTMAPAVTGCGSPDAPPAQLPDQKSSPSPSLSTPPLPSADPVTKEVTVAQWQRMVEAGMWREGCPATRETLRRVEINYWDFEGEIQRGVLVVNEDITASVSRIFTKLFDAKFPIYRMQGVEAYDGDNNASLNANNTAAYNCRRPNQINAPVKESPHANGRAVDINPVQNPWQDLRCKCWSPAAGAKYAERVPGKGVIVKGGVVWQAFIDEGWVWQNIKVPDYMHFDTGYPSGPFTDPA